MTDEDIHASITLERVVAAIEDYRSLENPGFCLACGADAMNVEPDAREYICSSCNEARVFGAEEVLMMISI